MNQLLTSFATPDEISRKSPTPTEAWYKEVARHVLGNWWANKAAADMGEAVPDKMRHELIRRFGIADPRTFLFVREQLGDILQASNIDFHAATSNLNTVWDKFNARVELVLTDPGISSELNEKFRQELLFRRDHPLQPPIADPLPPSAHPLPDEQPPSEPGDDLAPRDLAFEAGLKGISMSEIERQNPDLRFSSRDVIDQHREGLAQYERDVRTKRLSDAFEAGRAGLTRVQSKEKHPDIDLTTPMEWDHRRHELEEEYKRGKALYVAGEPVTPPPLDEAVVVPSDGVSPQATMAADVVEEGYA